jgi:hypothetical protein
MISGNNKSLFSVLPEGYQPADLAAIPAESNYVLIKKNDNSWEVNTVDRMTGRNILKPVVSNDIELKSQIDNLFNALLAADFDELTSSELNNTQNTVNDLVARLDARIGTLKNYAKVDRIYDELRSTEKYFIEQISIFVNFMSQVKPLTKAEKAKLTDYLKPFREMLNVNILPAVSATPSQSEREALMKAKRMFDSFANLKQLTANMKKMISQFSTSALDLSEFNNFIDKHPIFAKKAAEAKLPTLSSFVIMPVQRGPRYELLLREMKDTMGKVNLSAEDAAIRANFSTQFETVQSGLADLNEKKRSYDNYASTVLTQDVLGLMTSEGETMLATLKRQKASDSQLNALNIFLINVDAIRNKLNIDNMRLGTDASAKQVLPRAQFYEPFLLTFINAYLSHKHGDKKDLAALMLTYLESIDKRLVKAGLPPIIFKARDKIAGSTVFMSLAAVDHPDDIAVRNKIINTLFVTIKNMLENTQTGNVNDKLAYDRALTALNLMGPEALKVWNEHARKDFFALTLPTKLRFEDHAKQAVSRPQSPRSTVSSIYSQLETGVANVTPVSEPAAFSPNHFKSAIGKIANEIKKADRKIAKSKSFTPTEVKLLKDYSIKMLAITQEISNMSPGDGNFPSDKFYAATMDLFTAGFLLHQKHANDIFAQVIRSIVKDIDSNLHQMHLQGIIYRTKADLPGNDKKDLPALKTIGEHPEYCNQKVAELFSQLKSFYKTPATNAAKEIARKRMVEAIRSMGEIAMQQWNRLAIADKNLSALVIPVNKGDKSEPASETQRQVLGDEEDNEDNYHPSSRTSRASLTSMLSNEDEDASPDPDAPPLLSQRIQSAAILVAPTSPPATEAPSPTPPPRPPKPVFSFSPISNSPSSSPSTPSAAAVSPPADVDPVDDVPSPRVKPADVEPINNDASEEEPEVVRPLLQLVPNPAVSNSVSVPPPQTDNQLQQFSEPDNVPVLDTKQKQQVKVIEGPPNKFLLQAVSMLEVYDKHLKKHKPHPRDLILKDKIRAVEILLKKARANDLDGFMKEWILASETIKKHRPKSFAGIKFKFTSALPFEGKTLVAEIEKIKPKTNKLRNA